MGNQKGGATPGAIIKMTQALVLFLFVALLAFSAGTFVGKKVSDSEHRRAQLEGEYRGVSSHDEPAAKDAPANQDSLSDDEIASLTEEFVTKDAQHAEAEANAKTEPTKREVASEPVDQSGYKKYAVMKAEPTRQESAAHVEPAPHAAPTSHSQPAAKPEPAAKAAPATKPVAEHPSPAATRVAEGSSPAPDVKDERRPMSILPTVAATAVGKYTVQVASYPDEGQAKSHAADLKTKGWNAFYIPAEIQGKTWYRVSVGLFTNAKNAAEFRKEFQKEANVATAIVQKIVK